MQKLQNKILLLSLFSLLQSLAFSWNQNREFSEANNLKDSSGFGDLQYHMGPVLASPTLNLYVIWYGRWNPNHRSTIRDFVYSISNPSPFPSVSDWWSTVRLYTDQTGSNVTSNIVLAGEFYDSAYSHGRYLSRLSMQSIIKSAVSHGVNGLPLNPNSGLYLVLTGADVQVEDFCRAVCGFHHFTFPYIVGATVSYAWVGYSGMQCPGFCAYPFSWDKYSMKPPPSGSNFNILKAPNGDAGVDGMISVIAHELAEASTNPLINAWYAGNDPITPNEIADMCLGQYGSGGGGGYIGQVSQDHWGNGFNVNGVKGRKFLVQWIWNPVKGRCFGPNALN